MGGYRWPVLLPEVQVEGGRMIKQIRIPNFGPKCLVCGWGACLLPQPDVDCAALIDDEAAVSQGEEKQ